MPRYRYGIVAELTIEEMQEHADDMHPYVASVRVLSRRFEAGDVRLPNDFQGYTLSPYTQWKEQDSGHGQGETWIIRQYITLDERASLQQVSDSMNFQLRCFTTFTPCNDGRKLLPSKAVPATE